MLLQAADGMDGVAPGMVRDTVHAVVDDLAYRRSISTSVLGRIWRWTMELLDRIIGAAADAPHGRTLVIAGLAVIVLLVIGRLVFASRLGVDELGMSRRHPERLRAPTLADADRLAADGRHDEAVHALYQAVLEWVARRDGIRLHASKTSGDYARELRRRGAAVHQPFRQFSRRHDRIVFGSGGCDAATWAALRNDAEHVLRAERAA